MKQTANRHLQLAVGYIWGYLGALELRLTLLVPKGKHSCSIHSSNDIMIMGNDLYRRFLGNVHVCFQLLKSQGGPFNTPDLILTGVDGQRPKFVRVATVPDLL